MKRNLITILSLVVTALMFNATAYGQSFPVSDVQANVPFAFNVGTARLPAGCYGMLTLNQQGIMIRNCKTGATVFSLVQRESPQDTTRKLVFDYVGGQYFLSQIWGETGSGGRTVPTSKLERELQLASGGPDARQKVVVAVK